MSPGEQDRTNLWKRKPSLATPGPPRSYCVWIAAPGEAARAFAIRLPQDLSNSLLPLLLE